MRTIAVYSELDRDALHVEIADEAWNIGPPPAAESYLNSARILQVARAAKADAIHPGYGFLSENAKFARDVIAAGLIWVGPPPDAIEAMGDKITSRRNAEAAGVPTVPGTTEPLTEREPRSRPSPRNTGSRWRSRPPMAAAARDCGLSIATMTSTPPSKGPRREADAYFGSPEVYVEKYLPRPRHIEARSCSTPMATVSSSANGTARCSGATRS